MRKADALVQLLLMVAAEVQLSIEEYHHCIPEELPALLVKAATVNSRDLAEVLEQVEELLTARPEPARLGRGRVLTKVRRSE